MSFSTVSKVKFHLRSFLKEEDMEKYIWHITNIYCNKPKDSTEALQIILTMHRPGIFIGKGGRLFNKMEKFLEDRLGKIKLDFVENKTW